MSTPVPGAGYSLEKDQKIIPASALPEPKAPVDPTMGLKIILMGPPGAGKTHSIRTLIDAGLEVFCILTEPNAINTLNNFRGASQAYIDSFKNGQLHYKFISPAAAGWASMIKSAKIISITDLGALQKMPAPDKRDYMQFVEILTQCSDFQDELTGKSYGPVDNFDPRTQVLVIDSLSGLNKMCLSMVCGSKAVRSQPEWGVAIDHELGFCDNLTCGMLSHVIIMAHVIQETDSVMGGIKTMVNGLGKKAPQELPKNFTDCIFANEEGGVFSWTTMDPRIQTKSTTLVAGKNLKPDFAPLFAEWNKRLALTQTGVTSNE